MSEIWNLSTLCRCCHADGYFKSLESSYQGKNDVEIYEIMLRETFGISISSPVLEASYTICDECISKLRDATDFKNQVLICEQKFKIYCDNEQFVDVKPVIETENNDFDHDEDTQMDEKLTLDVKKEYNYMQIDIKHPIEEVKKENEPKSEVTVDIITNEDKTVEKSEVSNKDLKNIRKTKKQEITKNSKRHKTGEKIDVSLIIQIDTDTGTRFSCKDCGGCYQTKQDINKHINKTHSILYKCEYCPKQLKTVYSYKNHIKLHTGKKIQCNLCPKKFISKYVFETHLNSHTRNIIFQCDLCKKDFKYKQTLAKHLKLHAGTSKKILCDLCGRSFNDQSNLNAHKRAVHEKLRPFPCKFCGKSYTSKRHLKDHLKIHNGENYKLYKCEICDYTLSREKAMKVHKLKHENKFMCRYCSEIFDDVLSRKKHSIALHHENHCCHLCGKILAGKYSLKRHLDDHEGIKKFSCDLCGLKFSQKAVLNRHNFRKHNPKADINIGKTKCNICKHSFKNIVVHMDSHNKRVCACEICGKTYPDNSSLNRHKCLKHFGRTFDCSLCDKKYKQKAKLNTHRIKVHKVKIEKDDASV